MASQHHGPLRRPTFFTTKGTFIFLQALPPYQANPPPPFASHPKQGDSSTRTAGQAQGTKTQTKLPPSMRPSEVEGCGVGAFRLPPPNPRNPLNP